MNQFCFNKKIIIGLITIIVILLCYQYYLISSTECPTCKKCEPCLCPNRNSSEETVVQEVSQPLPPTDVVRNYDYRKYKDPLEEPTRRVARHEIHPAHLKRLIDIPSRGYPDNFTQIGVLVKMDREDREDNKSKDGDDNKILRLFGRQEFPGSYKYEYYTMVNSGLDQIKIPLDIRRKELYDGDKVRVKELDKFYRVNLYKYDAPKYYPDIIF